jgi:diguanylate cyclase (GGDEF)-like protein
MTFNIIGDHYITLYIANTIRIVLQLLLLGISYKWYGVTFKKTLKLVNVKTTYLMSCYMILALILLVNSFSWNNHILTNRNGVIEMILFILFIILGYFIVFLGISSFSKNILLKQNMNSIKKQSKINYMLANYDDLTGIATRQNIFNQISKAADEFKLSNVPFALIIFDIDRFKSVNDRYGHIIGDTAITLVAKIAANCLSQNDSIGRLGGDEFIIFSKGIHTTTDAEFLIRRIQNALKTPLVIGDHLIQIDISIGISFFPSDSQLVDELYEQADKAMYLAKKSTGTSFNFFQL